MDPHEFNDRVTHGTIHGWYQRLGDSDASRTRAYESSFAKWILRPAFRRCLQEVAETNQIVNDEPLAARHALRELFLRYACGTVHDLDQLEREFVHRDRGILFFAAIAELACLVGVLRAIDF